MKEEFTKDDLISHRERFNPTKPLLPKVDEVISHIVGHTIFAQDPRLIKLIVKWKANKPENSMEPDNFLQDQRKIAELKEVLSRSL